MGAGYAAKQAALVPASPNALEVGLRFWHRKTWDGLAGPSRASGHLVPGHGWRRPPRMPPAVLQAVGGELDGALAAVRLLNQPALPGPPLP